jgi:hypothetical protein
MNMPQTAMQMPKYKVEQVSKPLPPKLKKEKKEKKN